MPAILQDLRFALRTLRRAPGFAAMVIATLAIGIGANATIFSVVRGVLLKPLPYGEPERIVQVWGSSPEQGFLRLGVSLHDFEDWRARSATLEEVAVYNRRQGNLAQEDRSERLAYALVTPGLFKVLGVAPAIGRTFEEEENLPGGDAAVVVSHGFWRRMLGSDPRAVGGDVALDGRRLTVVGVMPEGFYFPTPETELWKPFGMRPDDSGDRGGRWVSAVGRLAQGRSLAEARAELTAIAANLEAAYPDTNHGITVYLEPRHELVTSESRRMILVAWSVVGLLLLIACANVANLFLTRATGRGREMAIRGALGAGRGQLVRQLMVESLTLAALGGAGGAALATGLTRVLRGMPGAGLPRTAEIALDAGVLGYAAAASLLTAVLFGLVPALAATRFDLRGKLAAGGRGVAGRGRRQQRLRQGLVIGELSLAVVVLAGAGLLLRSFLELASVEPGFATEGRLAARLAPAWSEMPDREQAVELYRTLLERAAALPGVEAAAAVNTLPLAGTNMWRTTFEIAGQPPAEPGRERRAQYRTVTPGYFDAMGIRLLEGRAVGEEDSADRPAVVVIGVAAARRYFPSGALGERVSMVPPDHPSYRPYEIVGVVADVRDNALDREPNPVLYVPFAQAQWGHFQDWGMTIVLRTAGEPTAGSPAGLIAPLRSALREAAPGLPPFDVQTLGQRLGETLSAPRFNLLLLGAFSLAALVLGAVGVYGVTATLVGQRTPEIGLRIALGARRRQVLALVIGGGMRLAAIGVVVGSGLGLLASRGLRGQLFEISHLDPWTFAVTAALLLAVALLACWLPARRAASLEPMRCLRGE